MTPHSRILRARPLAAAILLAACASAAAQTYEPPPAPAAPGYDGGDPADANLALVDRSPEPPPPLPVYVQPPAPADGYIWVPGYWSRNRYGFFWVPGAWVLAPYTGALWTPGYWGFVNGLYIWNAGYWGPHVGFYGGINYGFGYTGLGYVGGYWKRDRFYYNRSVTNVNITRVTNVYNHTVVVNNVDNRRVSYHGGPSGIQRRADPRELAARNERHAPPTQAQRGYVRDAGRDRNQFYEHNKGRPPQAYLDHRDDDGRRPADRRPEHDVRQGNGPDNGRGGQDRGQAGRRDAPQAQQQGRDPRAQDQARQQRQHDDQDRQQQVRQQQQRDQQAQQQARQQQQRDQQAQQQARQQQQRDQQAQQRARQQQQREQQAQQQARQQQQREQQAQQQARQQGGEGRGRDQPRGDGNGRGSPGRD